MLITNSNLILSQQKHTMKNCNDNNDEKIGQNLQPAMNGGNNICENNLYTYMPKSNKKHCRIFCGYKIVNSTFAASKEKVVNSKE